MKRLTHTVMSALLAAVLCQSAPAGAQTSKDQPADGYKHRTGTIKNVQAAQRSLTLEGFLFLPNPTFHLGDNCLVLLRDRETAGFQDLRPGQRVHIQYRVLDGVKVAHQIAEDNPDVAGPIVGFQPEHRTFEVKDGLVHKAFVVAPDCVILGREQQTMAFEDLGLGHRVQVTYLNVGRTNRAIRIEHRGESFTGTLEALDADTRALRAQRMLAEERFTLASSCSIIVDGKMDGKLGDLRLGDKLRIHYEVLDGVRVAHRIERQDAGSDPAEAGSNQAKK